MDTRTSRQDAIADGTRVMLMRFNTNDRGSHFSDWKTRHEPDGSMTLIADFEDGSAVTWPIPAEHVQFFIELVAIDHAMGHVIAERNARRVNATSILEGISTP